MPPFENKMNRKGMVLCVLLVVYICLQYSVVYWNPYQHLSGIDHRMGGSVEWERNYLVIRVCLDEAHDLRAALLGRAEAAALVTRQDPAFSMFRARLSGGSSGYAYEYTGLGLGVLAIAPGLTDEQMITHASGQRATAVLGVHAHGFLLCINHQFIDGITALSLLRTMMDVPEVYDLRRPVRYVPLLSELYHLPRILRFLCATKTTRYLPYVDHTRVEPRPAYLSESLPIAWLKAYKTRTAVSFGSVMSAYLTWRIFKAQPSVPALRVGVIVGLRGARRFNNYGVVYWEQPRPYTEEPANKEQAFVSYIQQTHSFFAAAYQMAEMTYTIGNAYNTESTGSNTDVLISGLPLSTKRDPTFCGSAIVRTTEFVKHASVPFYVMHVGTNTTTHLSWSIRDGSTTRVPRW